MAKRIITISREFGSYNFYTDQNWGKASNYTLCLNSSQLGYDRCEMISLKQESRGHSKKEEHSKQTT